MEKLFSHFAPKSQKTQEVTTPETSTTPEAKNPFFGFKVSWFKNHKLTLPNFSLVKLFSSPPKPSQEGPSSAFAKKFWEAYAPCLKNEQLNSLFGKKGLFNRMSGKAGIILMAEMENAYTNDDKTNLVIKSLRSKGIIIKERDVGAYYNIIKALLDRLPEDTTPKE